MQVKLNLNDQRLKFDSVPRNEREPFDVINSTFLSKTDLRWGIAYCHVHVASRVICHVHARSRVIWHVI